MLPWKTCIEHVIKSSRLGENLSLPRFKGGAINHHQQQHRIVPLVAQCRYVQTLHCSCVVFHQASRHVAVASYRAMPQGMWHVHHIVPVPVFTLQYTLWCLLAMCEPLLKKRIGELRACSCNQATALQMAAQATAHRRHRADSPVCSRENDAKRLHREGPLVRASENRAPMEPLLQLTLWLCCVGRAGLWLFKLKIYREPISHLNLKVSNTDIAFRGKV